MKSPLKVNFLGMTATVNALVISQYRDNGATAVIAEMVYDDGMPEQLTISVNLMGVSDMLGKGLFLAKNYSEREELYAELVKGGWLAPNGSEAQSGYVRLPVCMIGEKAIVA